MASKNNPRTVTKNNVVDAVVVGNYSTMNAHGILVEHRVNFPGMIRVDTVNSMHWVCYRWMKIRILYPMIVDGYIGS